MHKLIRWVIGSLLLCLIGSGLSAAVINAKSCEQEDVQAAVDEAEDGDLVRVPAGECEWSAAVEVRKAITLQGAGIGKTIIRNVQTSPRPSGDLQNNEAVTFLLYPSTAGRLRVSGFELDGTRRSQGILVYGGDWAEYVIDNNRIVNMRGKAIETNGMLSGLVHSNKLHDNFKAVDTYAGTSLMNLSWQTPLTLGTTKNTVIEDNLITYEEWYPRRAAAVTSHGHGGRATWRFNVVINRHAGLDFFPLIDAHGNQLKVDKATNSGNHRGTRQLELYGNSFTSDVGKGSSAAPAQIRGGTALIYDNRYHGSDVGSSYEMREEDGPARFGRLTTYPGEDQHRVWMWNNVANGSPMGWYCRPESAPFMIEGTNIFARKPQSGDPNDVHPYKPLPYPHPWRASH